MSRKILHILTAALLLLASLPLSAASRYWSSVSPLPDNLTLYGLQYLNGQFIAVGERGAILTSTGGSNWVAHMSGQTADLNGITFDGSNYLAVGGWDGTILRSTGITLDAWQHNKTGHRHILRSIAYNGSNLYVAVGDGDTTNGSVLVTSTDGINWTLRDASTYYALRQVIWDGSQFVIVGGSQSLTDGLVMTGTDGINWTHTSVGNGILHSISTNGSGLLVAVGDCERSTPTDITGPCIATSKSIYWSNGGAWTAANINPTEDLRGITFGNPLFLAVGENGTILYSSDGDNWSESFSGSTSTLHATAWGGGQFVVAGYNTLLTTTDPSLHDPSIYPLPPSWPSGNSTITESLTGITTNTSGVNLAVSASGNVYSSSDGFAWSLLTTTVYVFNDLTWDAVGNQYVAIAGGNTIVTSPDGSTWSPQATGIGPSLNGIASNGTTAVVVGDSGMVKTSAITDLMNWSPIMPVPTLDKLSGITWNADKAVFLLVSNTTCSGSPCSNILQGSSNGQSWSNLAAYNYNPGSPLPATLQDIAWGGSQYFGVGNTGNIMFSNDGQRWQFPEPPDTFQNLTGISWRNSDGRFIAVGNNGVIIASAGADLGVYTNMNGVTLTEQTPVSYTFTIKNSSSFDANNVILTIDLPPVTDAEFSGGYDPGICSESGQTLTCIIAYQKAGGFIADDTYINVDITPLVKQNYLNITATVSAAGPESLPSDNILITTNYVQSLEDKIAADFNASSGGGAGLGSIGLGLLLAGWMLVTGRRRMSH